MFYELSWKCFIGGTERKAKRMMVSGYTKEVLSFNFLKTRRIDENKVCDSLHIADRTQHTEHKWPQGVPGWAKHQGGSGPETQP